MARICRVLRARLWWGLLLCVLSITVVEAATRKHVSMPSAQSVASNPGGSPSKSGSTLSVPGQAIGGEFIPGVNPNKGATISVQPKIDFSIPTTINAAKSALKGGGFAGALLGAAMQGMLDAVGAFIDESGNVVKPGSSVVEPSGPSDYYWYISNLSGKYSSPASACEAFRTSFTNYTSSRAERSSDTYFKCYGTRLDGVQVKYAESYRQGSSCAAGSSYDSSSGTCVTPSTPVLLSDADWQSMTDFASGQSADWLNDLVNEACSGALSPAACADSLKSGSSLSGPLTVNGPSETSSTTYTKPDGTTGTQTTTTNTKFNITYGPSYYDYSKSTTVTVQEDGQTVSQTTTDESPDVTEEQKSDEEDQASPCTAACDGPAYEDKYQPTEDTKESALGDYVSRVSSIPILSAAGNFFNVSVSASCPTWEVGDSMELLGERFDFQLTFDAHCQSWFTSYQPYAAGVFLIVCAFLAFRVGVLD